MTPSMCRAGGGRGGAGGRVGDCQPKLGGLGAPHMQVSESPSQGRSPSHSPQSREDWIYGSRNLGITLPESDQPKIVKNQNIRSSNPA